MQKIVDSVEAARQEIQSFYSAYDSMRYIREDLILRLTRPISDAFLETLNRDYADIVTKGKIERTESHPYEEDEEHLSKLPRLKFHFNRRETGRLRQMIDAINRGE